MINNYGQLFFCDLKVSDWHWNDNKLQSQVFWRKMKSLTIAYNLSDIVFEWNFLRILYRMIVILLPENLEVGVDEHMILCKCRSLMLLLCLIRENYLLKKRRPQKTTIIETHFYCC